MNQRQARKIGNNLIRNRPVDYRPATVLTALRKVDYGIDAWWLRSYDLYADGRVAFFTARVIRRYKKQQLNRLDSW